MYCTKCGKQLEDTDRFCKYCGEPTGFDENKNSEITDRLVEKEFKKMDAMDCGKITVEEKGHTGGKLASKIAIGFIEAALVSIFVFAALSGKKAEQNESVGNENVYIEVQEEPSNMEMESTVIPWEETGLQDHVIDWRDKNLETGIREITGITDGDIMLSDVWEITELSLANVHIKNISALSNLPNLTKLYVYNSKISNISVLETLPNLTSVSLISNLRIW